MFLSHWKLLFAGSLTALAARWLFYIAVMSGEATYVMPFFDGGLLLLITAAAPLVFPEERMSRNKLIAIVVLVCSVLAISIS